MRKVSIVASRTREWTIGSWLITKCLKTDYSHVSWIFWNKEATNPRYYECTLHGGVRFTGRKFWDQRNLIVFQKDYEISEDNYQAFLDDAIDRCGEEYGLLQNIGIQISQWFSIAKNIFSTSKDTSNCSELIFNFKDYVGLRLSKNDPDLIDPKDIVEACRG